jgi:hypothetical protein
MKIEHETKLDRKKDDADEIAVSGIYTGEKHK